MRAIFNRLCNVRHGQASTVGVPNQQFAENVPCRVVPQTQIRQYQFPFSESVFWITLDELSLVGPDVEVLADGVLKTAYLSADQVQIPSLNPGWYIVCREEFIEPRETLDYYRYQLIPLVNLALPQWQPRDPDIDPPPGGEEGAELCENAPPYDLGDGIAVEYVGGAPFRGWFFLVSGLTPDALHSVTISGGTAGLSYEVLDGGCGGYGMVTGSASGCLEFTPTFSTVIVHVFGNASTSGTMFISLAVGGCSV